MTFDEYIDYENTIERMGKAKAMDADMQEKWKEKITELRNKLVEGFEGYFEFWITGGQNDLTDTEKRVLGCFIKMRGAISMCVLEGNIDSVHTGLTEMRFILFKLRGREYAMPHFKRREVAENDT